MKTLALLLLAGCLGAAPALAQEAPAGGGMDHSATEHGPAADAPSSKAYTEAMKAMHAAMAGDPLTGDADRDFLQGMIAHHEGAIAMAKVELRYGKDAKAKALARTIVDAQGAEIAKMRAMLAAMK